MQQTFFEGLKVVELASVLAGPAVGMFFAELGAEVIKVENKTTQGDVTRRWKLPTEEVAAPISAYYCSVNWKKQVKLLDLRADGDRAEVVQLLREADVVISNFKMASAKKLGLDYAQVKALNPRIIYAQLTGFGADSARPAFDVVLQAEAGFLFMTGEPGRAPVKMPVALIDLLAAHQLKEGILLGLIHRGRTGRGCLVRTSLLEAAVASLANQATNWLMGGFIPQAMGSAHPNIAPYGDIFWTKDEKPLVIAVGTERHFQQLCQCLGLPQLVEDERFATNTARVQHRALLAETLSPAFKRKRRTEWMAVLEDASVPAGAIRNMQEVFELDAAQQMVLQEQIAGFGSTQRVATISFTLTE